MHHVDHRNNGLPEGYAQGRQRYLLANLIASVDGKNAVRLADALLARFGTLSSVMHAPDEALSVVARDDGALAHLFRFSRQTVQELFLQKVGGSPINSENEQFLRFVVSELGHLREEALLAVFLDGSERYLAKDIISQGDAVCLSFEVRRLLRKAVERNAYGIVLAHNHPSGEARPSNSDIVTTRVIRDAAEPLGISLNDHLIVAGSSVFSMKRSGQL